jgi:hypothetical protein
MRSSRTISHVNIELMSKFRGQSPSSSPVVDDINTLMMETQIVSERLDIKYILIWLIALEDFIETIFYVR